MLRAFIVAYEIYSTILHSSKIPKAQKNWTNRDKISKYIKSEERTQWTFWSRRRLVKFYFTTQSQSRVPGTFIRKWLSALNTGMVQITVEVRERLLRGLQGGRRGGGGGEAAGARGVQRAPEGISLFECLTLARECPTRVRPGRVGRFHGDKGCIGLVLVSLKLNGAPLCLAKAALSSSHSLHPIFRGYIPPLAEYPTTYTCNVHLPTYLPLPVSCTCIPP